MIRADEIKHADIGTIGRLLFHGYLFLEEEEERGNAKFEVLIRDQNIELQFKSQYWYLCTDSLDRLDSLASSQWPQTWSFWMGWFPEKVGNETCIHNSLLTYEILGPMDCTHIYTCIDTGAERWGEAREPRLRFSWPAQVRRSKVAVGCEHYRN